MTANLIFCAMGGFAVGVIAATVAARAALGRLKLEHAATLSSVQSSRGDAIREAVKRTQREAKSEYAKEIGKRVAELKSAHVADVMARDKAHAAELVDAYKRGKESDGLVRDEKSGQMRAVKPKVKAKK